MNDEVGASAMDKKAGNRALASNKPSGSNDNGSIKQFGKGRGKRREYNGGKYYQESSPRKPPPQKSRSSVDKRPRSRGGGYQYGDGPREDVMAEYQADYDSVLNSRKKVDLNHLLNFTYSRRESYRDRHHWVPSERRGSGRCRYKSSYNKEQFLQANCQFIVKEEGDYSVHQIDPDTLVDWESVQWIRVYSHEVAACPICLEPPSAAKITRCGHIYCWPCILHYLALGEKTWRKCPICYESIHDHDLKSVVTEPVTSYKVGDTITMTLMRREKGSVYAVPAESWENREGKFHNVNDNKSTLPFMKLLTATNEDILKVVIEQEKSELTMLQEKAEASEMAFIEGCFHKIKEREDLLTKAGNTTSKSLRTESGQSLSTSSDDSLPDAAKEKESKRITSTKPSKQYKSAFSDEEEEDDSTTENTNEVSEVLSLKGQMVTKDLSCKTSPSHKALQDPKVTKGSQSLLMTSPSQDAEDPDVSTELGSQPTTSASQNTLENHEESMELGSPPQHTTSPSQGSGDPKVSMGRGSPSQQDLSMEETMPVEEAAEHLEIPEHDKQSNKKDQDHNSFYFYQAADGQRIYIHAVNARCLVKQYGALQFSPRTITAKIVEMESIFMSEELRKRLRYLGHLPLTSEFEVAEVDLRPPIVSRETLKFFTDDIERRKRLRQKKSRQEKRWSKRIQDEEKKQMGISPGMTIVHSQFMSGVKSENRPVSPAAKSDDSSQSSSVISPVGSPIDTLPLMEEDEGQQTSMSFAQMLKDGASNTPVWPKMATKTEASKEKRRESEGSDQGDTDEKVHTSVYNLGDAMQIALDNLTKSKDDSPFGSGMTKLPGKKKKKQQKLLFTTSMARGGNN